MAEATSLLMKDANFRTWLKEEALQQFDGDYDVLIQHHLDHKFLDGESLRDKLTQSYVSMGTSEKVVATFLSDNPLIQFAVPVNIEKWNAENEVVSVSYVADDFEDETVSHIETFFADKEVEFLSTKVDPEVPVVVVGMNERVKADGSLRDHVKETLSQTSTHRYRQDGDEERLWQVNVPNMGAIEGWLAGKPEFRVVSVFGNGTYTDKFLPSKNRGDFNSNNGNNGWVHYNFLTANSWDWSVQSTQYTQEWIEEDGGIFETLKISGGIPGVLSAEVEVSIRDNDDHLGADIIDALNHTDAGKITILV